MSEEKIEINEALGQIAKSGEAIGESLKGISKRIEEVMPKKIIKIRKGEYLLEVSRDGVLTTYNIDSALDIKNWSLEQLGHIISNLQKVGYTKASVITIEKDDVEDGESV